MTSRRRSLGFIAAIVCGAVCATSCSHAINDDGNDITNPLGHNPGITTHILTVSVDRTSIGVGETAGITATFDGVPLSTAVPGNAPVVTVSDPSVLSCCALGTEGYSVGSATVTVAYGGQTQTINISVHALNGISALVFPQINIATNTATWTPPGGVFVATGSTVEFSLLKLGGLSHNVVFDAIPGAPDGISQNGFTTSANRQFSAPGVFTFSCTLHGETGQITVVAQ